MKKLVLLLSLVVLGFVFVGCGETTTEATTAAPTTVAPTTVAPTTVAPNQFPTLSGVQSTVTVSVGDTYDPFAGVTASDPEDGDLTDSITIDNLASLHLDDDNVVGEAAGGGTFILVYKVEDSQGAKAQQNSTVTVEVVSDPAVNIIVNGDFSLGTNGWANADTSLLDLINDGAGTAVVTDGELVVTVTNGSWDGGAFPRANQENLTFENGKTYEVSIDAKADTDGIKFKSQVGIFLQAAPWFTEYYYDAEGIPEFTVSTTYQTFTYKFTVTEPTTEVGTLTLELGPNSNDNAPYVFYFDNIVIKEATADPDEDAPIISGLDEVTITTDDTFDALDGVTVADLDTEVTVDDIVVTHDGGANVTEASGVYSFLAEGTYTFTYTVSDSSTNEAVETRTVNVVGDAEAPVILGLDPTYVINGFAWNPLSGITFTDNIDTTLTMDDFVVVVKDASTAVVDADTNGLYTFTTNGIYQVLYTLLDSSGNAANEMKYISVVDEPTGMTNLVSEGDFATITAWTTYLADWNATAATFDATSGAMVADITNVGEDTWHVQLYNETVDLTLGTTYIISFEASSTVARDILVEMINGNNQWTASLNTTTQRFAFEYTAGADVTDAKLNFLLGAVNGAVASTVTIDNVMVYEKVENANIVTEGDFATITAWTTYLADWNATAATFDATSGAMVADVTNVGEDTWHVQLYNETPDLVAGVIYTIQFDASSTVDRDIFFEVINGNNQFEANLTSTLTTFTFTWLSSADTTDAKINFLLGAINGSTASTITIDDVVITANPVN